MLIILLLLFFILFGIIIGRLIAKRCKLEKLSAKGIIAMVLIPLFFFILAFRWSSNFYFICLLAGLLGPIIGIGLSLFAHICKREPSKRRVVTLGAIGVLCLVGSIALEEALLRHAPKTELEPWQIGASSEMTRIMEHLAYVHEGIDIDKHSRESLIGYYDEGSADEFDKAYMSEIAPNADFICQLTILPQLKDTLADVIDALKSQLNKDNYVCLGWREGTEIYVDGKDGMYQRLFQFIDADTKTPILRYTTGNFDPECSTLTATGKRKAPPRSKTRTSRQGTSGVAQNPIGNNSAPQSQSSEESPATSSNIQVPILYLQYKEPTKAELYLYSNRRCKIVYGWQDLTFEDVDYYIIPNQLPMIKISDKSGTKKILAGPESCIIEVGYASLDRTFEVGREMYYQKNLNAFKRMGKSLGRWQDLEIDSSFLVLDIYEDEEDDELDDFDDLLF